MHKGHKGSPQLFDEYKKVSLYKLKQKRFHGQVLRWTVPTDGSHPVSSSLYLQTTNIHK